LPLHFASAICLAVSSSEKLASQAQASLGPYATAPQQLPTLQLAEAGEAIIARPAISASPKNALVQIGDIFVMCSILFVARQCSELSAQRVSDEDNPLPNAGASLP
jgi:hypothetical protein